MEPFILGTLIMFLYGFLPDRGILRNDIHRFATATALALGTSHFLDPQPLYFLSSIDIGATQYNGYLAAFQQENLDHIDDLTVEYHPAKNSTPIGKTAQEHGTYLDTDATDTAPVTSSKPSLFALLWKFSPLCIAMVTLFFTKYLMEEFNRQQDVKLAALYEILGRTKEELVVTQDNLVIATFRRSYHSIKSVNRMVVVFLLRLKAQILQRKLDASMQANSVSEALISSLREDLKSVNEKLAEAEKQSSNTQATISALRAHVAYLDDMVPKKTKRDRHPTSTPSTNAADATPPKLSADAAVFQPNKPSSTPSSASSPVPSTANPTKIPTPIGQGSTGTIPNIHNAPSGPNNKPVRHGSALGGRGARIRRHQEEMGFKFAPDCFGSNTNPPNPNSFGFGGYGAPQPGPITYPTDPNPFGLGNGPSYQGGGPGNVGGYGNPGNFGGPGQFQGYGGNGS